MILFSRNPIFNAGILLFSFGLFWSQHKDFCCDLKCGHDMGLDVSICAFLSFLYFSRDLSFIVSTFFSTLLIPHPAFLVITIVLVFRLEKFQISLNNQIQSNFNLFKSTQDNYNSNNLHHENIQQFIHYASYSKFKHHKKIIFPQTFNHAISEAKFE